MASDTTQPALTTDDELARRLCALAIAFSNARSAIPSSEIHAAYYPDLGDDAFHRKFARDRERLVECGLVIRADRPGHKDASWRADASSFADAASLSPDDALMVDVLGSQLVDDPSFAYRDELRLALAKVDHAFGALTAARVPTTRAGAGAPLQVMLACMSQGHRARVTYVDVRGNRSTRVVAPYGQFGLRGHVYLVCAQDGKDGAPALRTLRADRLASALDTGEPFDLPEDFFVEDHVLLPFQIGPTVATARLATTPQADRDMLRELDRRATVLQDGTREVDTSDLGATARWAIAAGLRPVAPEGLVEQWETLLGQAAQFAAHPMPLAGTSQARKARAARRGRPGAGTEARELVALAGALGREGAELTPAAVSARLGVTPERARLLMNLLLTACVGADYQLPLSLLDDEGVMLGRTRGVRGRAIRLTQSEAHALIAALDELGISPDDPLRATIVGAFAPEPLSEREARTRVAAGLSAEKGEALEACSRAISAGAALEFAYQGSLDEAPTRRHVLPQAVRRSGGHWYLDAHDYERQAPRTFRIGRMADIRVAAARGLRDDVAPQASPSTDGRRDVLVAFTDPSLLDLLEWPGLEPVAQDGGTLVAHLPYYGGTWLPRHLAACGYTAWTDDEELAAHIREQANALV